MNYQIELGLQGHQTYHLYGVLGSGPAVYRAVIFPVNHATKGSKTYVIMSA